MNMTLYNILVPVLFLTVAIVGILIFHFTDPDRRKSRRR